MSEQREKDLWKELDRLAFLVSVLAVIILTIAYFIIAWTVPGADALNIAREFALEVIANLIPTFLLFAGAYALFRRIQTMKSDREIEELTSKVTAKVIQALVDTAPPSASTPNSESLSEQDRFSLTVSGEFEITDKHFDDASSPQRIVVQFTNRGNNIIRVQKVKFSATRDLPDTALLTSYRKESGGRYIIIPFEPEDAEVLPGQDFVVELCLAQKWERNRINGLMGKLGYLKPDVIYNEQPVGLFYAI